MLGANFIFVVGSPRTGTTLAKEILNRHPRVHLFNELHFFEVLWEDRGRYGDLSTRESQDAAIEKLRAGIRITEKDPRLDAALAPDRLREEIPRAGGGYRGLLASILRTGAELSGAVHGGDSSPQDVLYLPLIHEWFPDAKIVGMVRDPRGFLSSYKASYLRQPQFARIYNPLTNSFLWRSYMAALLSAEEGPWGDKVHRLRYEDLVSEPEVMIRGLCDHLELDYDPRMIDVDRSNTSFVQDSPQRGITTGSRDRWRKELTKTEIWLGQRICGRMMDRFAYEKAPASPSAIALARILAQFPGRLLYLLFRGVKPFKMSKVRRALSLGVRHR
jgi:hypothetical protein